MRTILAAFIISLLIPATASASCELHRPWSQLLDEYVTRGLNGINRFDYDGLRADPEDRSALDEYIASLEATPVSELSQHAQFAFWANLYNALTVRLIVERAPSRSIRQIKPHFLAIGPWGMELTTVENEDLTLDDIEHEIMRERYNAVWVHYAVNCAALGCTDLRNEAWCGETLEADIDDAIRAYINHPRGVTVADHGLIVSSIYTWYQEDFGGSEAAVIDHLLEYAEPGLARAIRANPRISDYAYDWTLNQADPNR